jgi:hypothetical protein
MGVLKKAYYRVKAELEEVWRKVTLQWEFLKIWFGLKFGC